MKKNLRALLALVYENKKDYLIAAFCTLVTVMIGLMIPLIFSETVDVLLNASPSAMPGWLKAPITALGGRAFLQKHFWIPAMLVIVLHGVNGIFLYFREKSTAVAGEAIAKALRERIYRKLSYLPFSYHVRAETGDLVQRSTSDVETIRHFLSAQCMEAFRSIVMAVIVFSVLMGRNVEIALYSLMLVPFLLVASYVYFLRIHKHFQESDISEGKLSAVLQENLTGVRVVRAFGTQQQEVEKFDAASRDFQAKAWKLIQNLSVYWGGGDFITLLQVMITLLVCVVKAVRGEITIGTLIVFTSYISMLLYPIRQLGRILTDTGKSIVALGRINDILEQGDETVDAETACCPPLDGDIVFDHVSFAYEKGKQVLDDLCMTIPAGKTVAILGNTGSGKSTIVQLLQRLYAPDAGRITIGGVDIQQIDRKYLRTHVGLMLQEPFLYGRTILGNLSMAAAEVSLEQVRQMSRVAMADDFIMGFDRGYDTLLGERGVTLSGGQRQRVAIARTLLKENRVLIFDDSLSAVDMQTDLRIRGELQKSRTGVTTIIISHRISTLCEADRIFVLEKGRLSDEGTHEELAEREGLYKQIFAIQSALEEDIEESHKTVTKEEN